MGELSRIGVAIDTDLLEKFDELIATRGYSNRSEAFRDLIRAELVERSWQAPDSNVVGTVTLVYNHHVRLLSEKLTEYQHEHFHSVLSTLHVHLDHDNCLEVLIVRGKASAVKAIADTLISTKGVKHGRLNDHLHRGRHLIVGTGIDLAEVDRIRSAIERHGNRFIDRIYTPNEVAYVESKANRFERYAARFAAKEAGMKAIGTGWRGGVRWHDFEVANLPTGKPTLQLHGVAARLAATLGVQNIALSMTHTPLQGMALVILEG